MALAAFHHRFHCSRDRVVARRKPPSGLQLFEFCARHGIQLADTVNRLQGLCRCHMGRWRLLSLLKFPPGLRAMQSRTPCRRAAEWRNIECLAPRDFYHRYTVDEHTLVAVENLEAIEDKRFESLWNSVEEPALVRFALLLHDIGKGTGRDHSQVGFEIADAVMTRLGAPREEVETIQFLVLDHLAISKVMSSRDLSDPSPRARWPIK
jgi:[protein-PII] uridylyltransferase